MKKVIVTGLLTTMFAQAFAQPAAPAPAPAPVPAAAPTSTTTVVVAAPAAPAATASAQLQLSAEDADLIADGEIGTGAHIGGGVASLFIGFGVGQAVQGRWGSRGWIFTLGEGASIGLMIGGLASAASSCASTLEGEETSCGGSGMAMLGVGVLAYSGFRIWEVVDAFVAPSGHNRRVRAAKLRANLRPSLSLAPYLVPVKRGDGAVAGLSLQF